MGWFGSKSSSAGWSGSAAPVSRRSPDAGKFRAFVNGQDIGGTYSSRGQAKRAADNEAGRRNAARRRQWANGEN